MKAIHRFGLLLVVGAFAWTLAMACGSGGDERTDESEQSTLVAAPIDDLELITRESFPPQYAIRVVSGLPNGCHKFNGHELSRDGTNITIRVTNRVPTDPNVVCTQVYGQHEEVVELGADFESGAQYTVHVNEKTLTFTAQ
jgi:hypothetical protein